MALASILNAPGTSAQSLSYSTYLPTVPDAVYTTTQISVNQTGDACIWGVGSSAAGGSGSADFITKLRSDGTIVYSLAPSWSRVVVGIDAAGNCYAAGLGSINPTPGAFQMTPKHSSPNQWVTKLDGNGNTVYATYLGGSGADIPYGIAVDSLGDVYLTGSTQSNDFPTKNAYQPAIGSAGEPDVFTAVLNPTGSDLVYGTYWGGSATDVAYSIAVDAKQNAYIAGSTCSPDFPTVAPFQPQLVGPGCSPDAGDFTNAFVIKLDPSGKPLYSTYLSGTAGGSSANSIAADANGAAYVTGVADTGFPLVNPIETSGGGFVSKLGPTGSGLVYSTYLGQKGVIALDSAGQAYIAGRALQAGDGGPSVPLALPIQKTFGTGGANTIAIGPGDGFVTVLNSSGTAFVFSTYLGGSDASVSGLGTDSSGNIYLGGVAGGPFPILNASNGVNFPLISVFHWGPVLPAQIFFLKINPSSGSSLSYPATADLRPYGVLVGDSIPPANLLVANDNASGDIAISNIAVTIGDFSQTNNCPSTLRAATECEIQLTFTPTAGGQRTGTITIADSAPGSPHVINLVGTGLAPQLSLSPTSLTFASQNVGTSSSAQVVTVTDTGGASLAISNISASGDFSESNNCGSGTNPGAACTISVVFSPTASGNRIGTLTVVDSAPGSPHTVSLSGTGAKSLGLGLASGGSNIATVAAGKTASYALSLGGGGIGGTASISCMGAPQGATCNVPATETVNATTPANFNLSVSTASRTTGALRSAPFGWLWAIAVMGCVLRSCVEKPKRRGKWYCLSPLVLVLLLSSCGGGGSKQNPGGTPAGNYTLTVTAALGASSESMNLTLQVQ